MYLKEQGVSLAEIESNIIDAQSENMQQQMHQNIVFQNTPVDQNVSNITDIFSQQMQIINTQMQVLSQLTTNSAMPLTVNQNTSSDEQVQSTSKQVESEKRHTPFGASVRINVKKISRSPKEQQLL